MKQGQWLGKGEADWKCNACGEVVRRDLGMKCWTPSFCEKTGRQARLYRVSGIVTKETAK